jgi:hypothetical protein
VGEYQRANVMTACNANGEDDAVAVRWWCCGGDDDDDVMMIFLFDRERIQREG